MDKTVEHPHISVVSPVYRGEKMVEELVARIAASVSAITPDYEIILVNDASPDNSWGEIEKACANDRRVKGLDLSRNFGQHYAITAGLAYTKGDWVIVMDCDLQDRPEEIPHLYGKAQEGYDIVYARRVNKKFGFWKKMSSTVFHRVFDWLSGMKTDETIANFGIFKRCVIDEYNKMPEKARSFGGLIGYLGFRITTVDVRHAHRAEGKSSYTLSKLIRLSTDIIISNSNKPLRMAVVVGFIMSSVSFALALYNVVAKLVGAILVSGYTTTVFSIWFVGGILLFVMGVLGLYIGKIFDQVKDRPLYVIRTKINF
ncbi:MAG: glycosyltransferase family 2 protein [Bacteroidia bacterium]|nr:glycosyltransferase family 2 protein [Bacteroidia bacterium]